MTVRVERKPGAPVSDWALAGAPVGPGSIVAEPKGLLAARQALLLGVFGRTEGISLTEVLLRLFMAAVGLVRAPRGPSPCRSGDPNGPGHVGGSWGSPAARAGSGHAGGPVVKPHRTLPASDATVQIGAQPSGCRSQEVPRERWNLPTPQRSPDFCSLKAALLPEHLPSGHSAAKSTLTVVRIPRKAASVQSARNGNMTFRRLWTERASGERFERRRLMRMNHRPAGTR